jgi:hypothetical protein
MENRWFADRLKIIMRDVMKFFGAGNSWNGREKSIQKEISLWGYFVAFSFFGREGIIE